MSKLEALIESFTNDESWNTEYRDGTKRFDSQIKWIEEMIKSYSRKFNLSIDQLVTDFESQRDYSWPNYYQESNFPNVDNIPKELIFEDIEEFQRAKLKFKCPKCKNVFIHPQHCEHRIKEDGKCDWAAYGLFKSQHCVIIKSDSLKPIPVLEPVL